MPLVLTCGRAAEGGHLEVLKWARAKGCPWNVITFSLAARGGHLDTLKSLRAYGCPWNELTFKEAVIGGHLATLKWLPAKKISMGRLDLLWCCIWRTLGNLEMGNCPWSRDKRLQTGRSEEHRGIEQ